MANHFWRDGGSRKVYLSGVDGLYDEMRLVVRTTTNAEIEASDLRLRSLHGATDETIATEQAKFLAKQITKWDAEDGGVAAPVNAENLRELQPRLYARVCNVVYGRDGGDPDPLEKAAGPEATATVEEREKNSAAG